MSTNPYESAPPIIGQSYQAPAEVYRPATTLAPLASWWLLCTGVFEAIVSVPLFFLEPYLDTELGLEDDPGGMTEETFLLIAASFIGFACITVILNITGIVLYCMFMFRANKNARALGAEGMEFTPGWTVGWHFIPIMNLFKPYQAVKEIFLASDPQADAHNWSNRSLPGWVLAWWLMYLLSTFLANIEFRLSLRDEIELNEIARWISIPSTILSLIAAVLVFLVIRAIHQRQQEKARHPFPAP